MRIIKGDLTYCRFPRWTDGNAWRRVRESNRKHLTPWEPTWPAGATSRHGWYRRFQNIKKLYKLGLSATYFIFDRETNALIGSATFGQIRLGAGKSATVGYWIDKNFEGKGRMSDALTLLLDEVFSVLDLEKVDAMCLESNHRSIYLLTKLQFKPEGLYRHYLKIDGVWRDHVHMGLLKSEWFQHREFADYLQKDHEHPGYVAAKRIMPVRSKSKNIRIRKIQDIQPEANSAESKKKYSA